MSAARIIDGKAFARALKDKVARAAGALKKDHGIRPRLVAVLVGDDPASHVYVKAKGRQAEETGLGSDQHLLPAATSEAALLDLIGRLSADAAVSGVLVQLPLPDHIDEAVAQAAVDPMKDVDGFHPVNVGRLWADGPGFVPCTPWGCTEMIAATLGDITGKRALVIGRSDIVGKPMAALLLRRHATVTIAHSRTENLPARCREADILVAAVGRPHLVGADWIKPGACVIDVGINRVPAPEKGEGKTRIVGDVDFEAAIGVAGAITPVPGGVGPMTIASLMRNTVLAAARQAGVEVPEL